MSVLSVSGRWTRVLEPTCGTGAFVHGVLASAHPPREVLGIEIQDDHLREARTIARHHSDTRIHVRKGNVFAMNLAKDLSWETTGPLLVVGNPPWVTNAELSSLGSSNTPVKENFKNLRGIEAMTGGSNFDIAEYIWLKLIKELAPQRPTIALLCKTAVARNVLRFAHDERLPVANATIRRINAQQFFGAAVDACLFSIEVGGIPCSYEASVYDTLEAKVPSSTIGFIDGQLVADLRKYVESAFADGHSPVVWRQGIKHDAAGVMELVSAGGLLENKLGERVDVEPGHVYPLLKSSDLNAGGSPRFSVIVTQGSLGDDTAQLQGTAPKLWKYLTRHRDCFANRKSSIYRHRSPFAMFGVGEYSFAPYKVAISGLYKTPRFRLIGPVAGRPVMLDDTCYFVPFDSPTEAALIAALLNAPAALELIESLVFWDSKRPITKALLQRMDLAALLSHLPQGQVIERAEDHLRSVAANHHIRHLTTALSRMLARWRQEKVAEQLLLLEGGEAVALRAARIR